MSTDGSKKLIINSITMKSKSALYFIILNLCALYEKVHQHACIHFIRTEKCRKWINIVSLAQSFTDAYSTA